MKRMPAYHPTIHSTENKIGGLALLPLRQTAKVVLTLNSRESRGAGIFNPIKMLCGLNLCLAFKEILR